MMTEIWRDVSTAVTLFPVDIIRYGPSCAPSVLILFINMMLFKSSPATGVGCQEFMFEGQDLIQYVFVVVALLCIPILLLGKPIYLLCCGRSKKFKHVSFLNNSFIDTLGIVWYMMQILNNWSSQRSSTEHPKIQRKVYAYYCYCIFL
jgi:hypothetical protein